MPSSNAAPKAPTSRGAAISAAQKLPVDVHCGIADIRAQHEECAVREVDDAHDAEDQRQADAEEEQQRGLRQRVEALGDEEGEEVHQCEAEAVNGTPPPLAGGGWGEGGPSIATTPSPYPPPARGAGILAISAATSVQLSNVICRQAGVISSPA